MTTKASPLSNDTLLKDVITSPRALKALEARGFKKVGDIATIRDVAALKGVGPAAIEQLRGVGVREQKSEAEKQKEALDDIEEGAHPIELRSKFPGYVLRLLGGIAIPQGHGLPRVVPPVAIEFKAGVGKLPREKWLEVKHERDQAKIVEELAKDPVTAAPWRKEAITRLRQRASHRRGDFIILE